MSKYIGDLVFSTGEYEKDGEKKKRWTKAGAAFEDEKGELFFKFEAMPAPTGDWSGFMKLFKKDSERESLSDQWKAKKQERDDEREVNLDDIPF